MDKQTGQNPRVQSPMPRPDLLPQPELLALAPAGREEQGERHIHMLD